MKINLTENGFYLDGFKIENKVTSFSEITKLVGNIYRKIELKYGIDLLIFDDKGIRLWIEDNKLNQIQIKLSEKESGGKIPDNIYSGSIYVDGKELSPPIKLTDVRELDHKFIWDDDSKQYGVNILFLIIGKYKFPFRFDEEVIFVNHLSS